MSAFVTDSSPLVGSASENGVRVVAFDFDHTLTVRDSVVPFVVRVAGMRRVASAVLGSLPTVVRLLLGRDNDALKVHFSRACLAGVSAADAETAGIDHARTIVSRRMRADTAARLRLHQEWGDVVVIVSASFGEYMHVVGDLLEVDAVLCTELTKHDGTLTGELDGANCRGEEKVRRLREWLSTTGLGGDVDVAYGDSAGDAAMLGAARVAVHVKKAELDESLEAVTPR